MASLGHIAVGMAAARVYDERVRQRSEPTVSSMAFWSALSMLPDADVIGLTLGIPYEDALGHRGATHSIAFGVAVGLLVGLAARAWRLPMRPTVIVASLVLVSHALLDTLTNGGLGCALFWPFDDTRSFAPWTPIPVSPIGLHYFSPYGLMVAISETVFFCPFLLYALWPFRGAEKPPNPS